MSLAKKWKSAIALFLAVVMALSFTPGITSYADVIPTATDVTAEDKFYDGTAFAATAAAVEGYTAGTPEYAEGEDATTGFTTTGPKAAGKYTVKVTYTKAADSTTEDVKKNFEIKKAGLTAAIKNGFKVVAQKKGTAVGSADSIEFTGAVEAEKTELYKAIALTWDDTTGADEISAAYGNPNDYPVLKNYTTGDIVDGGEVIAAADAKLLSDTYTVDMSKATNNNIAEEDAKVKAGTVSLEPIGSFVYTGSKIEPSVEVYKTADSTATLEKNTDYTIAGEKDAVDVGTYTMKIQGKGAYTGTVSVKWEITGAPGKRTVSLTNKDKLNRTYEWKTAVEAVTTVSPALSTGKKVTNEYYKTTDIAGAFKGDYTNVTNNTVTDVTAIYEDKTKFTDELKAKKIAVPVDAGTYTVLMVVPEDGNSKQEVFAFTFTIAQKPLYIVPDPDQKKTFGDKDKTITFKAYEYYNEGGEHKWQEYVPTTENLEKEENAKYAYDKNAGTINYNGTTVKLTDIRPNVDYDLSKIDQSENSFLTRSRTVLEGGVEYPAGEGVGTYTIGLNITKNDKLEDVLLYDTNYKAIVDVKRDGKTATAASNITPGLGLVTSGNTDSKLNNNVYTINKKPISEAVATFYDAEKKKWVADLTFKNDGTTHTPVFRLVDTINVWDAEKKTYTEKNDVLLFQSAANDTKYSTDYTAYNMVNVSGDQSNNAGENHNIQISAVLTGNANYSDSQTITWHIAPSGNAALIGIYADGKSHVGKYLNEKGEESTNAVNENDILDQGTYEVIYDGTAHKIEAAIKAVKTSDGDILEYGQYAVEGTITEGDVATILYKNATAEHEEFNYNFDGTAHDPADTWVKTVKPDEKWSTKAPTFTDVGTYKVTYMIESANGVFKSEEHSFLVEIKPLDVVITAGNGNGETFDRYREKLNVAAPTVKVSDDENEAKLTSALKTTLSNGEKASDSLGVILEYNYNTDFETAGKSDIQVSFVDETAEEIKAELIEFYNYTVKLGALDAYNNVEGKDLDAYNEIENFDELPADVKAEAAKLFYENLTDKTTPTKAAKDAEFDVIVDQRRALSVFSKNFNAVEAKNGTLTLNVGGLDLEVIVGDRQDEKTYAATDFNWTYGSYDPANSMIKLRWNDKSKAHVLGGKLDSTLASEVLYSVYYKDGGSTTISQVEAKDIDQALTGLAPGEYYLEARINAIPGSTNGGVATTKDTQNAPYATFIVQAGELTIMNGEGELVGGKTSAGKAPTKLEKVAVKETASGAGIAAGENTYKLQYKNAANKVQEWQDNLADLKDKDNDKSAWASKGKVEVQVRLVPLRNGAASKDAYYTWDLAGKTPEYVTTEIEVTAAAAGENDKVENLTIVYLAEDAGKKASAGAWVGSDKPANAKKITKTYGTFTSNKKNARGEFEYDASGNYIPVTNDNEIKDVDLITYIKNELLSNNGYQVGDQNKYGKYVDQKFTPYMDAQYFTEDVAKSTDGIYPDKNDGEYVAMESLSDNPAPKYGTGDEVATTGTTKQSFGAYRAADAVALVKGLKIKVKEVTDDDGVLATRTIDGKAEPIVSESTDGQSLNYTLAKTLPESGTASILVSVSRDNYADIEFYVNLMVDGKGPDIGVFNTDLGKETSTQIQKKLSVTDTYLKNSPEFTITTNDVEGGVYYTFATDTRTFANEKALEDSFAAAKKDKFDASKLWYELEGNTIQTPEGDGGYILYVRGEDASGNYKYASSLTGFTVDSVGPVIAKADDKDEVYGETAKTYLVKEGASAAIAVIDDTEVTVTAAEGEAEAKTLTPNASTLNYTLAASADVYSVKAVDKAGNETVALINVNYEVPNVGNRISVTYAGEDIDLAKVVDETDKETVLYEKTEHSGSITLADGTDKREENNPDAYVWQDVPGTRGKGTIEGTILKPEQAGTFVIEVKSEKNGIWGETVIPAYITVKKGEREVGIELVEKDGSEKTKFTKTEAGDMGDFVKLSFSVEGSKAPDAQYIKYNYYNKETGAKLAAAPVAVGDYEVSVNLETDGLWNATSSEDAENAKLNKKASYSIIETNKVVIKNEAEKGTVTVNDGTKDLSEEELKAVADRTKLTIKAEAKEGYAFSKWIAKGIELSDADAAKDTIEVAAVTGDIELEAVYVAKIVITKQPVDAKVYADDKAEFSVEATGNGDDDLTYQWMVKGATEAAFHIVTGATAATYTVEKADTAVNGNSYKVVITSKSTAEVKESDVAKLEIIGNSIEDAVVTFANDKTEYTGKEIAPNITKVTVNGTDLSASRDYDVAYDKILNAGEYTIKLTGKGDWSGETTATFTVVAKPVTAEMFTIEDVQYTGKAIEAPVVTDLVADTDYTVAYKNNTEVGTATATITGKGNYTGSVDVTFEILGKSIKGATVTGLATAAYTGKAITPKVTVKLDGKTLKKGTDYDVTYKNNTKVGTATVTITGKGDYSGTITKKFLIKKISFKYRAYVQKKNWMAWSTAKVSGTSASAMAGTTDNLRMETIQMQLAGVSGAIKYRAYVEKMGWTQWATTADTTTYAGTKGLSRRVEMIQLQASGQVATLYDMYYRAYSEKFGWLGWAKSGEKAGSAGYARKLEAFQVNFVRKGESFTVKSDRTKCFYDKTKDGANPK